MLVIANAFVQNDTEETGTKGLGFLGKLKIMFAKGRV